MVFKNNLQKKHKNLFLKFIKFFSLDSLKNCNSFVKVFIKNGYGYYFIGCENS